MISTDLFLREPLSILTPTTNFIPLDLSLCFNVGMVRYLEPNQFQLLIHHELIYHFTLPNIARTSVHGRKNWIYYLEGVAENDMEEEESDPLTPPHYYDPPEGLDESDPVMVELIEMIEFDPITPPLLDCRSAWDPPIAPVATAIQIPQPNYVAAIDALTMELAAIHSDLTSLCIDFYGFMDLVTTNLYHLC